MTDKEFAEIKRRFKPEKNNIPKVIGCCVSPTKEIVSRFTVPMTLLPDEQKEWLCKLLKKSISGSVGRNLMNIEFSAEQVEKGEEHKLLSDIRESELENEELLDALYEKIISSYAVDGGYLILLAYDRYDVPAFSKNDEDLSDSTEMFRYFVCSVCPIKMTKTALGFSTADGSFHNIGSDPAVAAPEIGFMFPCFDDRRTNIYNSVFYTRSTKESYPEVVEALFGTTAMMPAAEQKETFCNLVSDATSESRNLEFVQSVHGMISDMITEHKESHDPEPLMLDKNDVRRVLRTCGAKDDEMEKKVHEVNEHVLKQAVSSISLYTDDFSFLVARLCEVANEYLPMGDVVFVPDGPKPLIMAMSLVPQLLNKQGVVCMLVSRNLDCYEPLDVKPKKTILCFGFRGE